MKRFVLILAFALLAPLQLWGQAWSPFIDPSRATTWQGNAGFTIPNYTVACAIQLTGGNALATGSGAASGNEAKIETALTSCDLTHNVVNIPAGTWYVSGIIYPPHGHQVLRGAGPNSTTVYITQVPATGCIWSIGVCMTGDPNTMSYTFSPNVLPPSGPYQCLWTGGYAKGSTSITLNNCVNPPPNNSILYLDQANDTTDTNGIYICDPTAANCSQETGDEDGRTISGVTHSQQQAVWVTGVSGSGTGPYTVTIAQPVAFNNIRSGQNPGAFWTNGFATNDGLENMTIDESLSTGSPVGLFNCYQCWVKGNRFLYGARQSVLSIASLQNVVKDNYFYSSQTPGTSQSYGVEVEWGTSGLVIENNIFQQLTTPVMFGQGSGNVVGYNFIIDNQGGAGTISWYSYYGHNAGNEMNLWEGNALNTINSDPIHGSSTNGTFYRNNILGWQSGKTDGTYPVSLETWARAFNVAGNVLGQPGYSNTYESYATSTSGGVNGGATASTSIYVLGWTGYNGYGGCLTPSGGAPCDPLVRPTLMRWGNWDAVNNATQWNSSEAAPAAVPYVNANFTTSYFNTLAHTLPASLYYSSTPSWWPSGKAWPPVGPDVSSGNVGICTGSYAGSQGTLSSQCVGGTLSTAWGSHVTSIPTQDCFLNVMGGHPDGTGSVLPFDYANCASAVPTVAAPTFSSAAGTYTATQIVIASTSTGGASIIYTTNGSTPAVTALTCTPTNGTLFNGELLVSSSQTVKAIGCLASSNASSVASATYVINLPPTTTVFTGTEGSNAGSPDRDAYTNCAKTCSSGTPVPSPAGQRWCNSSQVVTCGSFGSNFVASTITGTGTHQLDNGLGAGGTDSLATVSVTYANASAGDCGGATNYPSALIPSITLPGAVANARAVFSGTTQSSNTNTSLLAPTKWAIPGGDAANYYIVHMCETVPTTSGSGVHAELDLNHTLSTDDYVGPGSHYNFGLAEWDYCPQGCSGWKKMNLVNANGIVTPPFPAGHSLYMEWYYHRTLACTHTSGSNCYFYDAACITDVTAGTPQVCGAWQDATTGLTPGGIPVLKTGFTTNQINVQHQIDYNCVSCTRSINSDFRSVVAYSLAGAVVGPSPSTSVIVLQ